MKLKTILTMSSFVLAIGLPAAVVAAVSWGPYVSEENGGPLTYCYSPDQGVSGFQCSGDYCDNVRIRCETLPHGITVQSYKYSGWFSEEDSGFATVTSEGWYRHDNSYSHVCNYSGAAGIMTGILCQGSYCDDINVLCATPMTHVDGVSQPAQLTGCYWTDWMSEEDGGTLEFVEGANQFITGVSCNGPYCDNKRFYVCSLQPATNSCQGLCGGAASECWCDAECSEFGDCCPDKVSVCGP